MSKKKKKGKKEVKEQYDKIIDRVLATLYRCIKNKKLFGVYMRLYSPLSVKDKVAASKRIGSNITVNINGMKFYTGKMKDSDFKKEIITTDSIIDGSYGGLYYTSNGHRINKPKMLEWYCENYFKKNKDNYKIRINQLKFEVIFGLLFTIIGMIAISFIIYNLLGYYALMGVLILLTSKLISARRFFINKKS